MKFESFRCFLNVESKRLTVKVFGLFKSFTEKLENDLAALKIFEAFFRLGIDAAFAVITRSPFNRNYGIY